MRCVERLLAAALSVQILAACVAGPASRDPTTSELDALLSSRAPATLNAGDKLRLTVFDETKLSGDYDIDAAGFVSLPLLGTVKAAGLSRQDLETSLARRYRAGLLHDPRVTVDIAAYRPFYLLGEVEKPGEYQYRSGLNVLSALAVGGGPTYRASRTEILIQKAGTGEFLRVPLLPTIPVLPGDLIRVPERYF